MPSISPDGPVWTLDLGPDENRFHPEWMQSVHACLDEMLASTEPAVLVTTGSDKFFSNGLDLDWLGANPDRMNSYVDTIHAMFARLLTLPVPTVAAVNGHAFGGGAMLAMCHDFRVMRTERGYFCFPEVDIQIPFTPGMNALITHKLTPQAQMASMLTGRRFGAEDALAHGIVDEAVPLEDLVASAVGVVQPLVGKDRRTLGTIKETLFRPVTEALALPHA